MSSVEDQRQDGSQFFQTVALNAVLGVLGVGTQVALDKSALPGRACESKSATGCEGRRGGLGEGREQEDWYGHGASRLETPPKTLSEPSRNQAVKFRLALSGRGGSGVSQ